jgi:protoporphyrinogen oxidase
MSGDWVSQRSKGMSLVTAVKDAVVPSKGKVVSLIDEFMYPRGGFGRLSERMADGIAAMGNQVQLESQVEKVHHRNGRVYAVTARVGSEPDLRENGRYAHVGGERQVIEGDNFISSIPLTHLARIMDPAPPAEVLEASRQLVFRDIITVNLMLKKRQVTPDTWLYVHDRNILFGRFHEPKNWSPAMVPSDDYTSLVVEYFCTRGDHVWNMTEEQLIAQTVRHLIDDLGFITRDEVLGGFTIRAPRAYPAYVVGYEKPLGTIKSYIASFENLQYIGRAGSFRYNNTDHSIETGLLAAKNILGERHDLDRVNADDEYHEMKRVAAPVGAART